MARFENPRPAHDRAALPRAPRYRAIWQSDAETEGGLDDLRLATIATQAEMFVRRVAGRGEPGNDVATEPDEAEMGLPTRLDRPEPRPAPRPHLRAPASWRVPTAQATAP